MEKRAMPEVQEVKTARRAEDSPVAWFAVLEDARRRGNRIRAAEAVRELRRLGVVVGFEEGAH